MNRIVALIGELRRRNVIRMAALYLAGGWLIVEVAGTLLPMFDAPGWIARSVVIIIAIGLLPAVLFAWVFEATPDGLKREEGIPAERAMTPHAGRRMDVALLVVVVLLAGYIGVDKLVLAPRRDAAMALASEAKAAGRATPVPDKSIAVLPFRNEGGNEDELYFSDGLSEDLITALSKFDGLKVIARDSAFQFRGSKQSSKAIAAQLGVAHLLSGSVRRIDGVVRINATLVDASDGSSLWSQRYDRPYRDLFALQDDITAAVSQALQAKLLARPRSPLQSERPPSGDLGAFEAVLRGNFNYAKRNKDAMTSAVDDYGRAIVLDPGYGYAYARRARARIALMTNYNLPITSEAVARVRADIDHALRLAPDSAEAMSAKSALLSTVGSDLAGAVRVGERAVKLAPENISSRIELAGLQTTLGLFEPATAGYEHALVLDPLSERARFNYALLLIAVGKHVEAENALQALVLQQPDATQNYCELAISQLMQGHANQAVATAKQEPDPFWRTYALAQAYWAAGDQSKADDALQALIREHADNASFQIATLYGQRGQPDAMFKWLEHARTKNTQGVMNDSGVTQLRVEPFVAKYRDDPRFIALARELGVMPDGSVPVHPGTGGR